MCAVGAVQHTGVPVDLTLVNRLKENWSSIIDRLVVRERETFDVNQTP